jgi:hypothetical protein
MPSVTARDNREKVLGVELTVLGGFLTTRALVAPFTPLVWLGVPVAIFGFWVTVDASANGADPRRDTGRTGGAGSGPTERKSGGAGSTQRLC